MSGQLVPGSPSNNNRIGLLWGALKDNRINVKCRYKIDHHHQRRNMLLVFAELSTHFCMEKWAISTTWSD